MFDNNMKEVKFVLYCGKCKHAKLKESEEPCNECLGVTARQYTRKPLRFEEDSNLYVRK